MPNRLSGSTVYLAGPIDEALDKGSGWRKEITPFLHNLGIGVFSPTDKAVGLEDIDHFQERERLIKEIESTSDINYQHSLYDKYHEIMKPIVSLDLRMVDLCSFVILYIDKDIHACGTYHESCTAVLQLKPLIVMCKQGKARIPSWLFGICKHEMFFSTWEEVKGYIQHIHNDPIIETLGRWKFFSYDKVFGKCEK